MSLDCFSFRSPPYFALRRDGQRGSVGESLGMSLNHQEEVGLINSIIIVVINPVIITIMILIIIIGLLYSPLESTIFIYRCFFLFSKLNLTHHNHRRRRREGFNSGSTN